jgi:hypothetical protein
MTFDEQIDALCNFNRKARVPIYHEGGRRKARARVWKVWAIHRSVYCSGLPEYTLTHIPTGLQVATHYSQGALAVLAVRLDALGDWSSSDRNELPLDAGKEVYKQWKQEPLE